MSKTISNLSKEGKEELALALILWKDFKSQGKMDVVIFKQFSEFAEMLGIKAETENLLTKLPPITICRKD